jgi:hypothetical protein
MFSTPEEVSETVRLTGASGPEAISTFVTRDPGLSVARVQAQVEALSEKCRSHNIRFDMRPKVRPAILRDYYTPGTRLEGRCLYPFLHARTPFGGRHTSAVHPRGGRRPDNNPWEVWTGEPYVASGGARERGPLRSAAGVAKSSSPVRRPPVATFRRR